MIRSPIRFYYSKGAFTRQFLILLLLVGTIQAQDFDFEAGNMPILIVSVHGGKERLHGANVRDKRASEDPHFSIKKDLVTDTLAKNYKIELSRAFEQTGSPSLLISRLHRRYVDLNRPSEHAAEHPLAKRAHRDFHSALLSEIERLKEMHGWVLVLDIHGQSAEKTDLILGTQRARSISRWTEQVFWNDILPVLHQHGFTSAPEAPLSKYRFGGGYITQHYGLDPEVDVVQLEHSQELRYSASQNRKLIRLLCERLALRLHTREPWFL